ncbi:unnamed protein product [Paramecium sonneborni]|uniref:Uncharacterized protein n=1 Tax=Paramecium sonneborni TaxID=65129 RepID=A0A8S1MDV6_9CILI|nr:unnamed protein product [Paramecium sonneborni]
MRKNIKLIDQDNPIFNSAENKFNSSQIREKRFKKINKFLKNNLEVVELIIESFTTLRVKQSKKEQNLIGFSLGHLIKLRNIDNIVIESFGLEKIFVIPSSKQVAFPYFGTFKIFYYIISIISTHVYFEGAELVEFMSAFSEFQQQNQDLLELYKKLGQVFFCQNQEDQENMKNIILNFKSLFPNQYIQILLEIMKVISVIIRLNYLINYSEKDLKETNTQNSINDLAIILSKKLTDNQNQSLQFSQIFEESTECSGLLNDDQDDNIELNNNQIDDSNFNIIEEKQKFLKQIFKEQLGINEQDNKIEQLFETYSQTTQVIYLNSNRIQGFAQFLYEKLIKSIFIQIGKAFSEKMSQNNQISNEEFQANFIKFPDHQLGGNRARPHIPNCYFVNFYRDLMSCWYETEKNQKDVNDNVQYMENLEKMALELSKRNDLASIKQYFKTAENNFIVQINHKQEDDKQNNKTFYQFYKFCEINKFEITQADKQLLSNSKLKIFQNQEYFTPKKFLFIDELIQTFKQIKKIDNKVYIYKIENNLRDSIKQFISDLENQELDEHSTIRIQNSLYSNQQFLQQNNNIASKKNSESIQQSNFSQEVDYLNAETQEINQSA